MEEHNQSDKLRKFLAEDLGEESVEIYLPLVQRLKRWTPPETGFSPALMQKLAQEMPQKKTRMEQLGEIWWLLMLRSQVRTIYRHIWIASLLVLALGMVVTLAQQETTTLAFALLAPVVAAFGVALIYTHETQLILELEESTLASANLLLLARLTLIFGFNLMVSLGFSVILALLRTDISLAPLVFSWFGPMTFLSALAFLLSVCLVDTLAASLFSISLWFLHIVLSQTSHPILQLLSLPGLHTPTFSPMLVVSAMLLVGLGMWFVAYHERGVTIS